jgi:thioester reductase-like protein
MARQDRGEIYFVTGYPAFLARNVIEGLLAKDKSAILAILVLDKHEREARSYIRRIGAVARARVIVGDVLKMHLGLSSEEYKVLANNVSVIFHAASISYPGAPEAVAHRVNLEGTLNVLDFAADSRKLKRLNHFSTAFVSGDRTGVVTEDELDAGQSFSDHISRTRFLAELEVRKAMGGLPISVFRPSMVLGNSATGEADKLEGFYSFVRMIIQPGFNMPLLVPRRGMAPLNVVPVDFAVDAAIHIAGDPSAAGKTFHLVDPNPLTVRQVLNIIAEKSGRPRPRLVTAPADVISAISRVSWISNLSPAYFNSLGILGRFTIYNCSNTSKALKGAGFSCLSFDAYADKVIGFVRGQLSKAAEERDQKALKDPFA